MKQRMAHEHYAEADRLLRAAEGIYEQAERLNSDDQAIATATALLTSRAQVHATLALAAVTADSGERVYTCYATDADSPSDSCTRQRGHIGKHADHNGRRFGNGE